MLPVEISNTASGPVIIGILAIIGACGKILIELYRIKHKAENVQTTADDAKAASEKAVQNTANVSNGFARDVGGKLDRIIESQMDLGKRLENHLQWHLEQTGKEKE